MRVQFAAWFPSLMTWEACHFSCTGTDIVYDARLQVGYDNPSMSAQPINFSPFSKVPLSSIFDIKRLWMQEVCHSPLSLPQGSPTNLRGMSKPMTTP